MIYSHAFEAFQSGDYVRASGLLEQAAKEHAYANDLINHTCTLALQKAGEDARLADFAYQVGEALLPFDIGSALDYFQRALNGGLDPERTRRIGAFFEERFLRQVPATVDCEKRVCVAHVVCNWTGRGASERYIRVLSTALKAHGVDSVIFTTESRSAWFFNPSAEPQSTGAGANVASVEGDFVERGERIAAAIRASGITATFYHNDLSDQIAAYVASCRPSPIQVNVNHGVEMEADLFDGFIHLSQSGFQMRRFSTHPAACVPPASDIELQLQAANFQTKDTLGIATASSVSATFAVLPSGALTFVRGIIAILKRFPRHFHLFAGGGDVRAYRGLLHSEGVLWRIRFLDPATEPASLLGLVDLNLVPFPSQDISGVLDTMGAGRPVVARAGSEAAELIGVKDLIAESDGGYVQIADHLLRDPAFSLKLGDVVQERFQREYNLDRFADRILRFLGALQNRQA